MHELKQKPAVISRNSGINFVLIKNRFRSESVEGNWCDEIVGTKNETKREKLQKPSLSPSAANPMNHGVDARPSKPDLYTLIDVILLNFYFYGYN